MRDPKEGGRIERETETEIGEMVQKFIVAITQIGTHIHTHTQKVRKKTDPHLILLAIQRKSKTDSEWERWWKWGGVRVGCHCHTKSGEDHDTLPECSRELPREARELAKHALPIEETSYKLQETPLWLLLSHPIL